MTRVSKIALAIASTFLIVGAGNAAKITINPENPDAHFGLQAENGTSYDLKGDQDYFLKNDDEQVSVGTVTLQRQPVIQEKISLSDISSNFRSGNYVKNFGGKFDIENLVLEKGNLDEPDVRDKLLTVPKSVQDIYDNLQRLQNVGGLLGLIGPVTGVLNQLKAAEISMGAIEFWSDKEKTSPSSFNINNAELNKYALLRMQKSKGYQGGDTSVNVNTLSLDNLSAIALGVDLSIDGNEGAQSPDTVNIQTLNVKEGGSHLGYTGIFSSDNHEIKVGTINIQGNTLDLSASPAQLIKNGVKDQEELKDLYALLKKYDSRIDDALHQGKIDEKVKKVLQDEINNLKKVLDKPYLSDYANKLNSLLEKDVTTTLNGVTLASLRDDLVTVNLLKADLDHGEWVGKQAPQIVLGDVAANLLVNFDAQSLNIDPSLYQEKENAVNIKGDFQKDKHLTLVSTGGYADGKDLAGTLNVLAGKITTAKDVQGIDGNVLSATFDASQGTVQVNAWGLEDGYKTGIKDGTDGGYVADLDSIQPFESNPVVSDIKDSSLLTNMMWRNELNRFNTRLGEIRDSGAGNGLWVRTYGGRYELKDHGVSNDYYGLQAGYDRDLNNGFIVGGALNYTYGDSDISQGSGDNYVFGLTAYGTYLAESGLYADLVGRVGFLHNSTDWHTNLVSGSADYNTQAYGLSAEVGWKFDLSHNVFVEPQAQLSYSHINSADYSVGSYHVDNDSIDSLIGRVGLRTGIALPEKKGSVYLQADLLKEFSGDTDVKAAFFQDNKVYTKNYSESLDSAWYELTLGTSVNVTQSTYVYGEVKYANGSDLDKAWGANVGLRYTF